MDEGITREEYVRIICEGYLVLGKPIPAELWDEWEAILAKDALAEPKSAEERLLEIEPEPLEVWATMVGGGAFKLTPDGPARDGAIWLRATAPMTGTLDHCTLMRPDGTILCEFSVNCNAMVAGDTLSVTIDAAQMLQFLGQ